MSKYLNNIGIKSKIALKNLSRIDFKKRNKVLESYSKLLSKNKRKIIKENLKDIKACKREELIDRLIINEKKIEIIRNSINEILNAVSEINEVKVNTQIKSKKRVDNDDIPKNTLKLIEQAEKSKD